MNLSYPRPVSYSFLSAGTKVAEGSVVVRPIPFWGLSLGAAVLADGWLQRPLSTGKQNFSFTAANDLEPQKRLSQAPPGGSSAHRPRSGTGALGAPRSARPPRAWVPAGVGTPWVRQGSPRPGASPGRGAPGPPGPAAGAAQVSPRPALTPRAREPGRTRSDSQEAPWRARSLGASGLDGRNHRRRK